MNHLVIPITKNGVGSTWVGLNPTQHRVGPGFGPRHVDPTRTRDWVGLGLWICNKPNPITSIHNTQALRVATD